MYPKAERRHVALRLLAASLLTAALCSPALAQFQGPPQTQPVPEQLTGAPGEKSLQPADISAMAPVRPVRIVPGDQLQISILGLTDAAPGPPNSPQTSVSGPIHQTVNADGMVQVPFIGPINTRGLTTNELADNIGAKLKEDGYILNPQVSVSVLVSPSQTVAVQGDVKLPNVFPVAGQRTLLDMLAAAGGLNATASHVITVHRADTGQTIQVLLDPNPANAGAANVPIYPGDSILVPRAGQIYVVGSVRNQMVIPIQTNTPFTVVQAVASAGGPLFEAALSKTIIIRTEGAKRKEIDLDLKKVLNGRQPDPILQADDIVYVPGSAFKGAIKGGAVASALSLVYGISLYR